MLPASPRLPATPALLRMRCGRPAPPAAFPRPPAAPSTRGGGCTGSRLRHPPPGPAWNRPGGPSLPRPVPACEPGGGGAPLPGREAAPRRFLPGVPRRDARRGQRERCRGAARPWCLGRGSSDPAGERRGPRRPRLFASRRDKTLGKGDAKLFWGRRCVICAPKVKAEPCVPAALTPSAQPGRAHRPEHCPEITAPR